MFEQIAAIRSQPMIFDDGEEPERLSGARVSVNFLTVLGVRPTAGTRDFVAGEDQPTAQPVVIISYSLAGRYGSRKETIGRSKSL